MKTHFAEYCTEDSDFTARVTGQFVGATPTDNDEDSWVSSNPTLFCDVCELCELCEGELCNSPEPTCEGCTSCDSQTCTA